MAFKSFECEEFDDSKSYLKADYTVECLSSHHTPIVVLGLVALLLYPIGVPFAFLLLLRAARPAIASGKLTRLSAALSSLHRHYQATLRIVRLSQAHLSRSQTGFSSFVQRIVRLSQPLSSCFSLSSLAYQLGHTHTLMVKRPPLSAKLQLLAGSTLFMR